MARPCRTWWLQDGVHEALECQRGRQVDNEGKRDSHWRVGTRDFCAAIRSLLPRVPAVAASLLHSADLPKERDFATVFYGGAPPSKQLAAEVKQRWPKAAM